MRLGRLAPLLGSAVVLAGLFASPALDRIDALSLDSLFLLRHATFGGLHEPNESPTVVIAIDEESRRSEEFRGLPLVMWTPQLGRVIDAVKASGAKLIGLGVILPTSIEPRLPDYDRPYLLSLKRAAADGRIVLAKRTGQGATLAPSAGQSDVVGLARNVRSIDLVPEFDGVVRRAPLFATLATSAGGGQIETSFALEIAARAGEFTPVVDPDGLTFGPSRVPGSEAGAILLDFDGGPGAIPTYSFADLSACATTGNMTYFKRAFAGKIVLIGSVLNLEDRVLASKRFIVGRELANMPARCTIDPSAPIPGSPLARRSLPEIYVHATAINNLLQGEALSVAPRPVIGIVVLALCGLAGIAGRQRRIRRGLVWLGLGAVIWLVASVGAFRAGLVLPLIDIPIAGLVAFAGAAAFRVAVTDRERNRIRRAFSGHLAPAAIERLLGGDRLPRLTGETRTVTVLFSGIQGFGEIADGMRPEALERVMNVYLGAVTELVELHGGFVDKYIGDAVVAVFGAPLDDIDHALNAMRAALACEAHLASLQGELSLPDGRRLKPRIGISTGPTLVGDIGSPRRFNYTAVGDAVELASRFERANRHYGTSILVSYETVASCGDRIAFREIDRVFVKGRAQPVPLFEPMAGDGSLSGERAAFATAYGLALADYRAGRFAEAAERFEALASSDRVSAMMAERCRQFVTQPPHEPWLGAMRLPSD